MQKFGGAFFVSPYKQAVTMKILFIGAGKMATALAAGIVKHNIHPASELLAVDVFAPAREAFTKTTGIQCVENAADYVQKAETILLAVKPQVAPEAVAALPPLREGTLVISICAGIPLAKLSAWFHTEKIIRVMPNTPLMVGKGASCFALGAQADAACAKIAETILGSLGIARQVTEDQLDAVTALSGSGPAYFFEMVKALADAGVHAGLSPELSLELTVQTLAGSAEMLCRKLGTPDELRDAVTSKKGTTAAGLDVMAAANFRKLMDDVVDAARRRSIELGQGK